MLNLDPFAKCTELLKVDLIESCPVLQFRGHWGFGELGSLTRKECSETQSSASDQRLLSGVPTVGHTRSVGFDGDLTFSK